LSKIQPDNKLWNQGVKPRTVKLFAGACILVLMGVAGFGFWFSSKACLFDSPWSCVLFDRNQALLGASIASDEQWRFPPANRLPQKYVTALLIFEDKRFYSHSGVDVAALLRAVKQNIIAAKVVSGASTITMQVIRLSRQNQKRTFKEKIIEMAHALRLEHQASKTQILSLYAAHAPFGGNIIGLEAAAWRYFGRDAHQLSWAQSALLAVLPNSPGLIHPGSRRKRLKMKRDQLLLRLKNNGLMEDTTYRLATAEPIPPKPVPLPMLAPHLLERVKSMKLAPGVKIITTLDKRIQTRAQRIVQRHADGLSQNGIHNSAALIAEVKTGKVVAYIGNSAPLFSKDHAGFVDLILAKRSTGSILKPLLYAGMLDSGDILPQTLVPDIPTRIGGFSPKNFNRTYLGAVPASIALARSLNVPAVRMLHDYDISRFYRLLKKFGMTTLHRNAEDYGLSLILGGAETTLWEMTSIYASIGRALLDDSVYGMIKHNKPLWFIQSQERLAQTLPVSKGACFQTFDALLNVVRPGLDGAWLNFESSQKIAFKTGTSYGFKDAWAIGVTQDFVVGVWAGNADGEGRPGLTGIDAAAPILFELFGILDTGTWFTPPGNELTLIRVCAKSGYRAGQYCVDTKEGQVLSAGLKSSPCPYCRLVHYDLSEKWQVHGECELISQIKAAKQFVLPPVMEWFYKRFHSDYRLLPPFREDCNKEKSNKNMSLALIYPQDRAKIYIPLVKDNERGRVVFRAAHRETDATLFWHLDDAYVGATRKLHNFAVQPSFGEHVLTLVDPSGASVQARFTILKKE